MSDYESEKIPNPKRVFFEKANKRLDTWHRAKRSAGQESQPFDEPWLDELDFVKHESHGKTQAYWFKSVSTGRQYPMSVRDLDVVLMNLFGGRVSGKWKFCIVGSQLRIKSVAVAAAFAKGDKLDHR